MIEPDRPFKRRAFVQSDAGIGARWWQESMRRTAATPVSRRKALLLLGTAGAAGLLALRLSKPSDEIDITMDALDLQRREGWDAGHAGARLPMPGASLNDVDGTQNWRLATSQLVSDLAPSQSALAPFYVPTLFQAPAVNPSLRAELMPVPPAPDDLARGSSIASLFPGPEHDTAVILDLPGPDAVGVAAGMARTFAPVFTFDNWPHPLGVVPSHLTLGAVLYELPEFQRARAERPANAPPVFVLDRNRLAHYTDDDSQFDNRYVAKLPTALNLEALGIKRILYVTPSGTQELDDLNDDFVAFHHASIDVKVLPLTDLGRHENAFYFGGHPDTHYWFWRTYRWPTRAISARPPSRMLSGGASYEPAPRPTIFSSRTLGVGTGVGKQKPSGFGRVSVRTSKSTGAITAVHVGRSGSFGRSGGWGGG